MRIAAYAIARDEEQNVDAWAATCADADLRVVADTGSTDNTVVRFARAGIVAVQPIRVRPWRFDVAWNTALALVPDDVDVCIRVDLDIRLPAGWREQIEADWSDGASILHHWFEHGEGGCVYRHTLIHARFGVRWQGIVHEVLVPDPRASALRADSDLCVLHRPDLTKDRGFNLDALRAARAESPHDLRLAHYLGRELMYAKQWDEAIDVLTDHATSEAFPEERSESWRYIGDCLVASRPILDVPSYAYRRAAETSPSRREGWVSLADLCAQQGDWIACLHAARRALLITQRSWYFNWPYAWGAVPHDLAARAAHALGRYDEAMQHGIAAVDLDPADERLKTNLGFYEMQD